MKIGLTNAALALGALLLLASPAYAKTKPAQAAANGLVQALEACRSVQEPTARLACYDEASGKLTQAVERKELVVMEREEIGKTRRSLFGFSLPRISLFRGEDGDELSEIEAVIASASPLPMGKWQIALQEGGTWQTVEGWPGLRDPKAGQKVLIKKGALGNYFIRINGQKGLRGRRVG